MKEERVDLRIPHPEDFEAGRRQPLGIRNCWIL